MATDWGNKDALLTRKHELERTLLGLTHDKEFWSLRQGGILSGRHRTNPSDARKNIERLELRIRQTEESLELVDAALAEWEKLNKPALPTVFPSKPEGLTKTRKAAVMPILERLGMTPNQWATKAGVDPSVVYDYLEGKSRPRPQNRRSLAEALKLKMEELHSENRQKPNNPQRKPKHPEGFPNLSRKSPSLAPLRMPGIDSADLVGRVRAKCKKAAKQVGLAMRPV